MNTDEQQQMHDLLEVRRYLDEVVARHRADIKVINDALNEKANDEAWCDKYEAFLEKLNQRLTIKFEPRLTEHTVTITMTVKVTRSVMATSHAEAQMLANDDPKSPDFIVCNDARYTLERQVTDITSI